jgi:hypothetical protein
LEWVRSQAPLLAKTNTTAAMPPQSTNGLTWLVATTSFFGVCTKEGGAAGADLGAGTGKGFGVGVGVDGGVITARGGRI